MRLINVRTYGFQEFFDEHIPPYAILSHRWGPYEDTFKDIRKGLKKDGYSYDKIVGSCALARSRGLEWVWIDSCCIDKRSSAELSEAINSMYQWYERSGECYVYMADVSFNLHERDDDSRLSTFRKSNWFNRGWTLQELIAPEICIFCDHEWRIIGRKRDLLDELSKITQIEAKVLSDPYNLTSILPRDRMTWVSRRKTTRAEDMAYCLLGLFQVNMPLLYGEGGPRAFVRLQTEILKTTDDESLFDWGFPDGSDWAKDEVVRTSGLLAISPEAFAVDPTLYPPFPPYAPPPNPYDPVDQLDPFDLQKRTSPIVIKQEDNSESGFGCPPFTWSYDTYNKNTIGNAFYTTKTGFVLNRAATKITWQGWDSYIIDLNCQSRNRFKPSIVLTPSILGGLAERIHYYGHGEDLRRRVGSMNPVSIGMRQFHVLQWNEYFRDTFSPLPKWDLPPGPVPEELPPEVPLTELKKLL